MVARLHRFGSQDHPIVCSKPIRNGGFRRCETNPLERDLLVVDEASMVDVPLRASLMRALSPHSGLSLVGER